MVKGLYAAYSGMINEQNRMDVLTNNLANSSTTGFKKEGATSQAFKDVLAYKIKDTSEYPHLAKNIGTMNLGVKIGENYTDYSQGAFRVTNNTFDLAISGTGFFTVAFTNKSGQTDIMYTRDGSFTINKEGYMVTKDGDFVLDASGRSIRLDPTQDTSIDDMGNISQGGVRVATVGLTDFEDYNYLEHYGENYFRPVEGVRIKEANAIIRSGYLEASNVQVVSEMVEMITVSRQYESNQKMIHTIDSTLEIASNRLGKV